MFWGNLFLKRSGKACLLVDFIVIFSLDVLEFFIFFDFGANQNPRHVPNQEITKKT